LTVTIASRGSSARKMLAAAYSILAVPCLCIAFGSSPGGEAVKLNRHPKLVVFSFDGFRYDYLRKGNAPTLTRLKREGVTTPYMIPQFTTKTFPNHQSIVTGLYPENHGIVENSVFDPLLDREVNGYSDDHDFWVYSNESVPIWVRTPDTMMEFDL